MGFEQWVMMGPYTVTYETGAEAEIPWPITGTNVMAFPVVCDGLDDWSSVQLGITKNKNLMYWGVETATSATFKVLAIGLFY